MSTREQLLKEIEQAPDVLVEEVFNFLLFTKTRRNQTRLDTSSTPSETHTQSEPVQNSKPIWELAEELIADIPPEILEKLPHDGAAQIDHYLYGSPKRES